MPYRRGYLNQKVLLLFSWNFNVLYLLFLQFIKEIPYLFIYSFCNLPWVTKNLLVFLYLEKSIIIIILQHAELFIFCIGVFTLFICLRMIIFTLFIHRINSEHCRCVAIHSIWNDLIMMFSPCFSFATDILPFYWFCCQFLCSNNRDSISFPIFLYWVFQASSSETLNDIV